MQNSARIWLAAAALFLAAILVFCVAFSVAGVRWITHFRAADRTITTKGFSQKAVTSDLATWSAEITVRSPQIAASYAKIATDSAAVLDFLEKNKLPKNGVDQTAIAVFPKYKQGEAGNTNEIELYELKRSVSVQSADIRLIDRLSKEITSMLQQGVEVKSQSPKYYYSGLESLKIDMLAEAARDGRQKAERIATSGGARLGAMFSAQQGVFQVTPALSFEVSDEGSFDTSSIEKTARAIVTAKYALE